MKTFALSSPVAPERPRLLPLGHILAFGLGVALVLLAAYPDKSLESRLESSAYGDAISQAYFAAWLQAKPDDHHLRLVLIQRQMQEGELKQAEANLVSILNAKTVKDEHRLKSQLMLLDLKKQELWRTPPTSLSYALALPAYLQQLRTVTNGNWSDSQLQAYADEALALGDRRLGLQLYMRVLHSGHAKTAEWYEHLARLCLAQGYNRATASSYSTALPDHKTLPQRRIYFTKLAADLYFQALPYTTTVNQRRHFFLTGLRTLQSGNLLKESIAAGNDHLGSLAEDPITLLYLVRLAQASNRLDLAEKYVARLIKSRTDGKGHAV